MVTHAQIIFAKDGETNGIGSIALFENGVQKCGSLVVDAEGLNLKNDLNEAVGDREYEIENCDPRKCDALPLVRYHSVNTYHLCD